MLLKLLPASHNKTDCDGIPIIAYADEPPLANEQKHFFQAVLGNTKPLTDGEHALEVLTILEKAQSKLRKFD